MIELSNRYALATALVLSLLAIPVWFHELEAPVADDCADPNAFFLANKIGSAQRKSIQWQFEAGDAKGAIPSRAGVQIRVRVFRMLEAWKLYGSPMSFGFDSMSYLVPREQRIVPVGDAQLPVQWSRFELDGQGYLEAWTFAQGGRPLWHPLEGWPSQALAQLLDGTRPTTVMIASAIGPPEAVEGLDDTIETWFASTWKQLRAACDS